MLQCEIEVQLNSFGFGYPVTPASSVEETILSLFSGLSVLIENQLSIDKWIYFYTFNSIPLVYPYFSTSLFLLL